MPFNDFGAVLIQALQAGEQQKRRQQLDVQEDEERQLRIDAFKHQQKELELEKRYTWMTRQREGEKEAVSAQQGQPFAQLPKTIEETDHVIGSGMNMVPEFIANLVPQQISGSKEFGVPGYSVTPKSQEEIINAQTAAKMREVALTPQKVAAGERVVMPGSGDVIADGGPKEPASEFAAMRAAKEAELGRPLTSTELTGLLREKAQASHVVDPGVAEMRNLNIELAKQRVVSGGDFSPKQVLTFNGIAGAYDRSPLVRAADRTIVLSDAIKSVEANPSDPASQLALAYSYVQALDTYQSAVREGELQNLGILGTKLQQFATELNRVANEGAFLPPAVAKNIAQSGKQLVQTIEAGSKKKQQEFASRAKVSGVGDMWDQFVAGFAQPDAAGQKIRAMDPQGNIHEAAAGTPLPQGWKLAN